MSVVATDLGSGIADAVAEWSTAAGSVVVPMTASGDTYIAEFGPFGYLSVPDSAAPSIGITFRVTDAEGNESKASISVVLRSLSFCFG